MRVTRGTLLAAAVAAGPAAGVLLALAALGALAWPAALAAAAAVALATGAIVQRHAAGLTRIARRLADIAGRHGRAVEVDPANLAPLQRTVGAVERRLAEDAGERAALAATTQAILDAIPDPIFVLDDQLAVVRANVAARELLGLDPLGRAFAGVMRDPALLDAIDAIGPVHPAQAVELTVARGLARHFSVRAVWLGRPGTAIGRVLVAFADTTALKRAAQMRADFVANVSHELRTPLATLAGFIETVRGAARDDTAARERFLAIMAEQTARMTRIVADLLSLARIEQDEHMPPTAPVQLARVVRTVADGLTLAARGRGIALQLDIAPDLPAVPGDADQLAQVFQNLLDNAIKYGRPNSTVRLAARLVPGPPRIVAVAVTDQGEGIAAEHLPRLTERFYRVDTGRSRQMGGTGLGLAIVKHILNRHRGTLAIASELGRGSTFTVSLPAL